QSGNGNELQQLAFNGTLSGGTFTISFAGRTTSAINSGASAATVQTALQAITTVGSGNVQVLGGPVSGANPTLLLKFTGGLANSNLAQATVSNSLTGVTSITATTLADGIGNEVQNLTFGSSITGGTYTITFNGQTTG